MAMKEQNASCVCLLQKNIAQGHPSNSLAQSTVHVHGSWYGKHRIVLCSQR